MTWDPQGPATPPDPRASGAYSPPPGPMPPPPPGYGTPGEPWGQPPPPPGYVPPRPDPWAQQPPLPPPGYGPAGDAWGPPPPPMWQPPPAYPLAPDAYPVNVSYDREARINRLWGIPVIGQMVRAILLIPHLIILSFLAILTGFLMLVVWVPVLIFGRQADLIYTLVGGMYRWQLRVSAYMLLMVDRYPPFSFGEDDPRL